VKTIFIGITRALAVAGVTDFSFVDDESRWKGSEIHRLIELSAKGTLDRRSVPDELSGHLRGFERFMRETGFIPLHIEKEVKCKTLGIRGRLDFAGLLRGKKTIVDVKSGAISPAVALQTVLYGHLLDSAIWWERAAVRIGADGNYGLKTWGLMQWPADLATALACARIAVWKIRNRLV
jgi:hypothetical protein